MARRRRPDQPIALASDAQGELPDCDEAPAASRHPVADGVGDGVVAGLGLAAGVAEALGVGAGTGVPGPAVK
jgi:hypothetical protein